MILSELGALLRHARKAKKLTLQQAAVQAGVHFTTLSALERGQVSDLGIRKVLRVAEILGLELVLRPGGQRYTLDDVARERAESYGSGEQPVRAPTRVVPRTSDVLGHYEPAYRPQGLLARALRLPADRATLPATSAKQRTKRPRLQPDGSAAAHGKRK